MKKIYTLFICTFILSLIFAFSGTALADEPTVAVSSSEFFTHQGEQFTTTVYIPDDANIVDFDITVKYNTELVSLVSAEESDDLKGSVVFNTDTPGEIAINYTRTSKNITSYMPILDLTFSVDENIGIGSYDCLSVDRNKTYIAHRLNASNTLDVVDFACNFSKLVIYEMGDVDLSKTVDIGDATYIRRHLAAFEGSILNEYKLSLADTYSDGTVDIADAVCLQRHLARLDVLYGNRVNITFVDINGNIYAKKSVSYDGTLNTIPVVPAEDGYNEGAWSQSAEEYITPNYTNLTEDVTLYAYYEGGKSSEAIAYYKRMLTDQYYSGDLPTNLSSDLNLWSRLYYQGGQYANLIWSSDCNYVVNSTTGAFTKPTYPTDMSLTARIISYDSSDRIEAEDSITFDYAVPGEFITPTKDSIEEFLNYYFTDETDGRFRVNYDVKLITKINNTVIPIEGAQYDNFEIRLDWYQNTGGTLTPISQIKRTTSSQTNDYVAVATFNGKPLEGDGKIYIDDVEVTPIQQIEIKNHIVNEIASHQGTLATDGISLWNNDRVYGTNVTWETGNSEIAYVRNNTIELKNNAVSGSTLPLNARVSYSVDGGTDEFILSYDLTISCDNTIIKAPENMDPSLYAAIKAELEDKLGYRGDLTSAALANVQFVNLDLSGYPDITSLRGLSYCTNLRTLNISGIHISDSTMNQISTLSYLEAFIARGCGLDSLSDGGTPVLRNAVNLKLLDLSDNNFTTLDTVFSENVKYGKLREVYLSSNKLTDISALQRAPIMTFLSLSDNGLTTESTTWIANYPYLQYLSLADNNIDSVANLTGLRYLTELRLQNNQLSDVRALRGLINLKVLYLGHNQIVDVASLNSLTALEVLYVNDNKVNDISYLTSLSKLELFNISNNNVASLSVLRSYKDTLTEVYAENNKVTDFSFINGASKLHILMLAGNNTDIAQSNMTSWLSGLTEMEVLTLSEIKLNDLSFLEPMTKLVRLDVEKCGISACSGETSNIQMIADKYAKLRILNISNNDFTGYEDEISSKLRDLNLLTVFYADNVCSSLDAYNLTYSMPELRYISFENCGITTLNWLYKYNNLVYVDLAGNNISDVDFEQDISNASIKTLKELYLDTNVPCSFANAYRTTDFNVEKLSLAGISVNRVENLPYLDSIRYLNLSNTGITNLVGEDEEYSYLYSLERYETVETLDLSRLEADIAIVKELPSISTLYAVGVPSSKLFYEDNLHTLQYMYNKGVTCYLYDKDTEYVPTATKEGKDVLDLIEDFSCDVTVAANNKISDNNPFIIDEINDFDITWSVSNSDNYEIVNNHLAVKDYAGIEDEELTVTASITVYPDQAPVSREFTINTHILRASPEYYNVDTTGYSKNLTRDTQFKYLLTLKNAPTEGFSEDVMPVEDTIKYSYSAKTGEGVTIPYPNVLTVGENGQFAINSAAPLYATANIKIDIQHNKANGTAANDVDQIVVPVIVSSRTFTATFVLNGGSLVDENNIVIESREFVEDSLIFEDLTFSRPGYDFGGWYTDEGFDNLFSANGADAIMPSHAITLYAKWNALAYNLIFDANEGECALATKSVLSDVAVGELPIPTRDYYTFDGWFTNTDEIVTSESVFARTEDLNLIAHWTINPISDWVLESNMPSDAQLVSEKWTYNETKYKDYGSSDLGDGWTLYNTTWYWSDWGNWSGWINGNIDGSESRQVEYRTLLCYYHFYKAGAGSHTYCPTQHNSSYQWHPVYVLSYEVTPNGYSSCNSATQKFVGPACPYCGASLYWFRTVNPGIDDVPQYNYRERYKIYIYHYKKTVPGESNTEKTNGGDISDVQKWVQYRAK